MTKPLRVLVFGKFYEPHNLGGVECVAQTLIDLLHQEVAFINLVQSKTRQSFNATMPCGAKVMGASGWNVDGSLVLSPALIAKAIHICKTFQPDLIHLHFPDPMSHLASLFLPPSIPRIISWHADIVRQKKLLKIYRPFLNRILKTAEAIIVATPHHKNSPFLQEKYVNPSKIHTIAYGTPQRFFACDTQKVQHIRQTYSNKNIIFSLGRHVSYKGFDVLIRAMAQLAPDVILLLGGQGPLTDSLKNLAQSLNLNQRVHFLGAIADEDLPNFYHACDVFCLPSVTTAEAFGLVQLEAMAAAKPVVSTLLGTGVDFVNQNNITGLTPPPKNAEALAGALGKILDNPHLKESFGAAALQRVKTEFSMEQMKEKTKDLYNQILRKKI